MVNSAQKTAKLSANVKLMLDFAPLAVFFIGFKVAGVLPATIALIAATLISITIIYAVERKLALAPLISGVLVTVLGGLSIILHDDQFIKMKPTMVNLMFSVILLSGVFIWKRGFLKHVLDVAFQLTDRGWLVLSLRWGFFFLFLAGLNEVIWRHFSLDFWVNFKVFGMFTLTMAFAGSQLPLLERYKVPEVEETETPKE